ncbi:MAG TPA: TraX family protein [Bacillota bacterium]|nr:TraX family protein [Bacillota bacterium]
MMNRNLFKIIAAISMTADHVGMVLLPEDTIAYTILRSIGRIAYVMFAYMIAEGYFKTKNLKMYFLRLFAFASIIELFFFGYWLATGSNYTLLGTPENVIWPLVFGLGALILIGNKRIWVRLLSIGVVLLARYLNFPYADYGVLIIMVFGIYPNIFTQFLFLVGLNLIYIDMPFMNYADLTYFTRYREEGWIQWFSLLAFIFIYFYNGKKGRISMKWFFYIFYPVHLGLIYLIDFILG